MQEWRPLGTFTESDQNKLRWLLRHARENGIVKKGVALKFGREWRINTELLPSFLNERTLIALSDERDS